MAEIKQMKGISSDDFNPKTDTAWLWTGDNLAVMTALGDEIVDLIYLDPPFNSKQNFVNSFKTADQEILMQFKDIWMPSEEDELALNLIGKKFPNVSKYINGVGEVVDARMRSYLIFMGIRLIELHRLLKHTGSIYLHCDSSASHYLKGLLDGIFGKEYFRNEIVWNYSRFANQGRQWVTTSDRLLFYSKSKNYTWNKITHISPGLQRKIDRGYDTNTIDGKKNLFVYNEQKARERIESGEYEMIKYIENPGTQMPDVWTDIDSLNSQAKERENYPTQKPISLISRIIQASSNENDLVFDPFTGCATSVIAAQRLKRRWICCDIAHSSVPILKKRIRDEYASEGLQLTNIKGEGMITNVINPDDISTERFAKQVRNSPELRRLLVLQELDTDRVRYNCNGCGFTLPIRLLEIDHMFPTSRGGDDSVENRILLCSNCNRSKGDKTWEEWKGKKFSESNGNRSGFDSNERSLPQTNHQL